MKIFAITGSIATGKSTVTKYLKEKGYLVIDSDQIAYDALTIDKTCIEKTRKTFNLPAGRIDRKALGKIIFNNAKAKKALEAIIHPYVIKQIEAMIATNQGEEMIFLDIPLLFENHLEYLCDEIIVVYLPEVEEIKRLMNRDNIDENYARLIISNQMSIELKKERADIVLDNRGTLSQLHQQIDQIFQGE